MTPTLRRVLEGLAVLALIGLGIAWLSGWFGSRVPPGEIEPPGGAVSGEVSRAVVLRISEPALEWTSGTLVSARHTMVSSRILARIEQAPVAAGDVVAPGDVLFVLDARDLEARVAQAEGALRAAEAERDLAATEQARAEELLKRGVTTRQRFDQAAAALRVAEAQVMRLARALEEARTALSYGVIAAPTGGRVVDRLAEPGDIAAPGQPLVEIYDPASLRAEAPVRETLAIDLAVGQRLTVGVPAAAERFEGEIDEIVPYAEPGARTLLVKVRLPADSRLFAGMYARVAVPAGQTARLVVPAEAVETIGQLSFVEVAGVDGVARRRMVTLGSHDEAGRVEVLGGLAEGEQVLVPRR